MDPRARVRWLIAAVCFAALCAVPFVVMLATGSAEDDVRAATRPRPSEVRDETPPAEEPEEPEERTRVVVGQVREPDGTPIAGALIVVTGFPGVHTETGADGRYRLVLVPLAARTVEVEAEGYLGARVELGRPRTDDEHADVELHRDELVGKVVDARGDPVAAITVRCGEREVTSDRAGRFRFPGESEGCSASAKDRQLGETARLVLVRDRDNVLQFGTGGLIAGVVTDERGAPVTTFTVGVDRGPSRAGDRLVVEDAAGRFELASLAAGRYHIAAAAPGRPPVVTGALELAPGEKLYGVRIVLGAGAVLRGRVLDADGRRPIEGARIDVEGLGALAAHHPVSATSDASGGFSLDGVAPGSVSIRVSAPGYRSRVASFATRTAGEREVLLTALAAGEERVTEYTGVAAALRGTPSGVVVAGVFAGGPAEVAGVRPGDVVVSIDAEPAQDFTVADCVARLRGPVGSWVTLGVRRPAPSGAGSVELELSIRREKFVR
ncbi:MAG: carboxypeptidase regulatory-like domain-containing protein [Polyangiaceae bacterium]|nr:carboxypeptidase regulatory-like domain-containing protein [Polyangiaceae bacterium]